MYFQSDVPTPLLKLFLKIELNLSGGGGVYKPRGQTRGRGVAQMTTTLNNGYLVKVSTNGGGRSKLSKILFTWFVHVPWKVDRGGI